MRTSGPSSPDRTGLGPAMAWGLGAALVVAASAVRAQESDAGALEAAAAGLPIDFGQHIEPVLMEYCYDCHGDGMDKGGVALDDYASIEDLMRNRKLWLGVWDNLRAHTMPPAKKDQPSDDERRLVANWIKREVFQIDCDEPDPGRVTIRRLNREEYRNTIRDLIGVDFDTDEEFPADDTGYGFDNIGDVLTMSPLLMEKYLAAAESIVARAAWVDGPMIPTADYWSNQFKNADGQTREHGRLREPADVAREIRIDHPGPHRVSLIGQVEGPFEFSDETGEAVLIVDGREIGRGTIGWQNNREITIAAETELAEGAHEIRVQFVPGKPPGEGQGDMAFRFHRVAVHGPLDGSHRIYPDHYQRVFLDGAPPEDPAARDQYREKLLRHWATRAFRRPADDDTVRRLTELAMFVEREEEKNFEHGVAHALTAVLTSPRFLFRAEIQPDPDDPRRIVPLDDFALASRLSYFLWSTMPDDELFRLAEEGRLRAELRPQVDRMLNDRKARTFVRNFVGQWLQTRDVETIALDPRRILRIRDRDEAERIFNWDVRSAMRRETEMLFAHIMEEDRSVLELLNPGYTFLNEALAGFYGIEGVQGREMQKVSLPADSVRGGILTQGSFLVVTSNPTRTSPVKRGLFVLENILGTPAPPAPPNVPPLEEGREVTGTMRERMVIHREDAMCASCHERMDPIGLALENFNAIGQWRTEDRGDPIDPSGELITGESFTDIRELRTALTGERRIDFYRCLTEKLLTYALGRGPEHYDRCTIDGIAERLDADGGKFSTLLHGLIESAPFLTRRGDGSIFGDEAPDGAVPEPSGEGQAAEGSAD